MQRGSSGTHPSLGHLFVLCPNTHFSIMLGFAVILDTLSEWLFMWKDRSEKWEHLKANTRATVAWCLTDTQRYFKIEFQLERMMRCVLFHPGMSGLQNALHLPAAPCVSFSLSVCLPVYVGVHVRAVWLIEWNYYTKIRSAGNEFVVLLSVGFKNGW